MAKNDQYKDDFVKFMDSEIKTADISKFTGVNPRLFSDAAGSGELNNAQRNAEHGPYTIKPIDFFYYGCKIYNERKGIIGEVNNELTIKKALRFFPIIIGLGLDSVSNYFQGDLSYEISAKNKSSDIVIYVDTKNSFCIKSKKDVQTFLDKLSDVMALMINPNVYENVKKEIQNILYSSDQDLKSMIRFENKNSNRVVGFKIVI